MRARVTDRYCVILLLFVASHVTGFSTSHILTYDRLQTHTRKRTPWEHLIELSLPELSLPLTSMNFSE